MICDNRQEASNLISSFSIIQSYGLIINHAKSNIILDRSEMAEVKEICGIKVVDKFKYLGV
jgi:hypothetical protein